MVGVDGVVTTQPLPAAGEIKIGRASTCDLVVLHSSVSRHHATLQMSPLAIIDAGSRNGTRVRGELLEPGVIQIGSAAILISSPAQLVELPRSEERLSDETG